jgi:FMN phosphatase YigB (HAD superfamily)
MNPNLHLAYFIDFHGTICNDTFWGNVDLHDREVINEFLFKNNIDVVNDWMRGQIRYSDVINLISQETNYPRSFLLNKFVDSCQKMRIPDGIIENLRKLRKHSKLILITTNMDSFKIFTTASLQLYHVFDDVFNSSDFGLLKTDKAGMLFEIAQARHGLLSSSVCLIDDDPNVGNIFLQQGGGGYYRVRSLKETESLLAHLTSYSIDSDRGQVRDKRDLARRHLI